MQDMANVVVNHLMNVLAVTKNVVTNLDRGQTGRNVPKSVEEATHRDREIVILAIAPEWEVHSKLADAIPKNAVSLKSLKASF